jgi:PAS domain S-box-containing protein
MDQIWLAAPSPAMRLWRGAADVFWRVNPAAEQWTERQGLDAGFWARTADELLAALSSASPSGEPLAAVPMAWTSVPLPDGWLVWFDPAQQPVRTVGRVGSADKLALAQEFITIGVFERDLRTGEGRWDAQMYKLFGLDTTTAVPTIEAAARHVHPDDLARFESEGRRFLREGGRHALRYRVVWPDRSVHDLRSLIDVRQGADGAPCTMFGVAIDDTEVGQRMREQEAVNNFLSRALRLARVSVWRIDVATDRVRFNDVGYEIMGVVPGPEGIALSELRSLTHPDDLPGLRRAVEAAMAGHDVVDFELRYRNRRGGFRPLLTRRVAERDAQGRVTGLIGITIDQSAQKAEREHAKALLRRIELVADAAELGIWSVDNATGRVEWNATMHSIYGLQPHETPPTLFDWRERHVHPDDHGALTESRQRSILTGANPFETEFRILRPDGTVRWVVSRSRREEHDGRDVLIGIHLDTTELITQRQLAEQALRDKELALRASRAKSDFLSRASHELRTPLNAVLGFAQLIEHDSAHALPAAQMARVSHIRSAGEHLLALVDDVLDLAAIEAGSLPILLAPVNVDDVLQEVVQWLGSQAQRRNVTLHLQTSGGCVMADARRLRQIVANLVNNAVKFNRAGGQVWVGAQPRGQGQGREHGVDAWDITVRDDGRGLTETQQEHLFEAFHRLGAEREGIEGVGLGLAIVRQLTELMDGRIEVVSAPGQGSEFRVTLKATVDRPPSLAPIARPDVPAVTTTMAAALEQDAADGPALTVLYIEDNPVNVILVEGLVALRPRVRLRCAVDGLSGVAMALSEVPDVVLIDMQLPDIDGYEVRRRLRAQASLDASLMVALSANGLTEDIARALDAGFDDYWTKPIDFKLFLYRLDALTQQQRSTS